MAFGIRHRIFIDYLADYFVSFPAVLVGFFLLFSDLPAF